MIGRELRGLSGKTLAATTKTPLAFDMEQRIVHYFDGSLLMWHEMDDVLFGHITKTSENFVERTVHGRLVEVSAALALWFSDSRASIEAPVGRPGRRRGRGARIWTRGPPSTSTPLLLVALAAARPTRGK